MAGDNINNNVNLGKTGQSININALNSGVKKSQLQSKEQIIFKKFDTNNNGILEEEELKQLQQSLQPYADHHKITKREARQFLKNNGLKGQVKSKELFNMLNSMGHASENIESAVEKDGVITVAYKDGNVKEETLNLANGNLLTQTTTDEEENTVLTKFLEGEKEVTTTSKDGSKQTVELFDDKNTILERTTTSGEENIHEEFTNGKLTKKTTKDGAQEKTETFDENEQLTQTVVKKGQVSEYIKNGKVVKKETSIGSEQVNTETYEYTGDKKSKSVLTRYDKSTLTSEFDANGNLKKTTDTSADGKQTTTSNYEGGKLTSQTVVKDGKTYSAQYDGNGNTKGVVVQNGESPAVIAKKFGVTKEALLEANKDLLKGKNGNQYFLVGQEIVIPGEISADNFAQMNVGRKTKEESVNAYKTVMAERERQQAIQHDNAQVSKNAETMKKGVEIATLLHEDMDGAGTKATFAEHLDLVTSENAAQVLLGYRQVSAEESLAEAVLDEKGMSLEKRQNALRGVFNKLIEQAQADGTFDEATLNKYKSEFEEQIKAHQKELIGSNFKGFDELFEGIASGITSTSTLTTAEKRQIAAQTPKQKQDFVVSTLTKTIQDSRASFDNQMKRDGWAADLADKMSVMWGSDNRANLVREDLAKFEAQLGKLKEATPAEFPEKFKEVFGVEYNPQMVAAYEKRKGQMVEVNAMYGFEQTYNKDMSVLLSRGSLREETDTQTIDPMTGMTTTVVTATKEQVYAREYENLAKYMGAGDLDAGKSKLDEIMSQKGLDPNTASMDEKYKVLREVAQNTSKSLHDNVMTLTEGKGYQAFKVESERMYAAAFGTGNDIAKRVEDYNISQQTGEAVVKGTVKAAASITLALATGGLGAAAIGTGAISAVVDFSDELTRGIGQADGKFDQVISNVKGLSAAEVGTILKNAAIDGATVYAGGKLTQGLMNAKTFVKIGGQMVGDVAIGTAAEYGQTGEITINGVLFQVAFSAAGNLVSLKQASKGSKVNSSVEGPEVQPLKPRDPIADAELARGMDQSHLNANERKMVQSALDEVPTSAEVEAFRQSLGEAPTSQQRVDIDAHNARVAEANAKAHQIGENIPDDVAARLNGQVSDAAQGAVVNPQIKALTDEISGIDGSIRKLEQQISGARKFGKNTQKLEAQLEKLQNQRAVKSAKLQNIQKPQVKETPHVAESEVVQNKPAAEVKPARQEAPMPYLTSEQRMQMSQIGDNIGRAKTLDDIAKAQAWLDKMPECSHKKALQKQLNTKAESFRGASIEQPMVQNVVNERVNKNGTFEKGKPVIVDTDAKLVLGGQYELDLSSPEIQAKLRNLKDGEVVTVGRAGDIEVPEGCVAVSRKHLEITRQGDNIVVKDISSNGTKVKSADAVHVVQNQNVSGARPELDKYVINRSRRPVVVTPEVQAKMNDYLDNVYNNAYRAHISAGQTENEAKMAAMFARIGAEEQLQKNAEHFAYMASRPDLFDVSGNKDWDCWMEHKPKDQHHGAWKMHMYSVNEEDWKNMCEAVIPYLKEHDIDWKTFNALSDATTLNGHVQQGKAFTVYPKNNEDMAQIAKDLDYIIRRNNLQTTNTSIIGDRAMGDNGRLFYRYELKSGADKDLVLDLGNYRDRQLYDNKYDGNSERLNRNGGGRYLADDMTPADDPWLYFDPSK